MVINNYSGSAIRFALSNAQGVSCVPRKQICLPHSGFNMGMAFEATIAVGTDLYIFALPCDFVESLGMATIASELDAKFTADPTDFIPFEVGTYGGTVYGVDPNLFSVYDSFAFWSLSMLGTNQCLCYFIFEQTYDGITHAFSTSYYQSQCYQVNQDCGTFEIHYSNDSDSLGLPYIPPSFYYTAHFWGKLWKPQVLTEKKSYIKSNNDNVTISSRSDEVWQLDVDAMNYEDHRALQVALLSDNVTILSKDFQQFAGLANYNPTGTENDFVLTENYNIKYSSICFETARGECKLKRKDPIGLINYQC